MKNISKTNMRLALNLQRFAGENNENAVKTYRPQFIKMLNAVFSKKAYFAPFFNGLQTLDDVAENETAFEIKVNNTPVVDNGKYKTGANVAFGTGTSNSNRFGPMQEIIYSRILVPYTWGYSWNEGIDKRTVGTDEATAVADRTKEQAKFKIKLFNEHHGGFISKTATALTTVAAALVPTQTEIVAAFEEASKIFTNLEVSGTQRAYVNSDVWNMIVNNDLATNDGKAAGVNIAKDTVYEFKGFLLDKVPDKVLGNELDLAYFTVDKSAEAFTGLATARTINSENFDGRAFQGAGQAGEFIIEDNKKAVLKLTGTKVAGE
mgnify:CR=1 FL=1